MVKVTEKKSMATGILKRREYMLVGSDGLMAIACAEL
jgi:hypothetical protein